MKRYRQMIGTLLYVVVVGLAGFGAVKLDAITKEIRAVECKSQVRMAASRLEKAQVCEEAPHPQTPFYQSRDEFTQGVLMAISKSRGVKGEFPLKRTEVKAEISGFVSRVKVTQTFQNPYKDRIEAIYVFPLPQNSAVDEMRMKIGNRTIRGLIKKKEEAKRIYERAKREGRKASLLEQERPNIFTQSVANIQPGERIQITIWYNQMLKYEEGGYEFVFPMVVGPRYIPGRPIGKESEGWAKDTDQVGDASRITPPPLIPGERCGYDITLEVKLNAGIPIQRISSPSHKIIVEQEGEARAIIRLKPSDTIPNKDFILRYKVAGKKPEAALITHRGEKGGFFALIIQPQADFTHQDITPKEMIFVVDCSGSMSGEPIAKAKEAMRRLIQGMNPDDTFQIIRFSNSAFALSKRPLPNTPENVRRGLSYINNLQGSGGTEMMEGIKASLGLERDPDRMRIVIFMTDGYIGNETQILSAIEEKLGEARLFSFGVGSSVNRYLLERMAEVGRGVVQYVRQDEPTEEVVERLYERISKPNLVDIEIDWGGLDVRDLYPEKIPDLFAHQPIYILGRYEKPGKGKIMLKGRIRDREVVIPIEVVLPSHNRENEALASLWARARIKELMGRQYRGEIESIKEEITSLAIEYRLMSKYTSFVAVEEVLEKRVIGPPRKVMVPVEMPEGVSFEGVFGINPNRILPGDPEILIPAPKDTSQIVAIFPFGEKKMLSYDEKSGLWRGRFLVPREVKDGVYQIKLLITSKEGDQQELDLNYTVDTKAPVLEVRTEVTPSGCIKIKAKPVVNVIEAIRTLFMGPIRYAIERVKVIFDVKYITCKILGEKTELKFDERSGWWIGKLMLPPNTKPGKYTMKISAYDFAGNNHTLNKEIRVNLEVLREHNKRGGDSR